MFEDEFLNVLASFEQFFLTVNSKYFLSAFIPTFTSFIAERTSSEWTYLHCVIVRIKTILPVNFCLRKRRYHNIVVKEYFRGLFVLIDQTKDIEQIFLLHISAENG